MLRKYIVLVGGTILLNACQPSPTFLAPASPIANHEASLYTIVLNMALVVFILVEGALVWIVIRDRKRAGDEKLPHQLHGNMRLEVVWTAIPILVVVVLFVMTVQTVNAVAQPAHLKSDLNIRVVGHRWWWEFDYPDLGIATANELHIPVDTTVQVALESVDVIHSFWVPQLSGKTDVVPGQHNTMWLTSDQVGEYLGQCAEFCGTEHALMRFKVFVDSQADFDAWVANQQQPAYQPQSEDEQAAYKEITGACAACHSIDPAEMDTDKVGPNLAHLFSRTTFAGGAFDLNESNLRSWLKDTQSMKPGNDMQITVPSQQLDQIIAYLIHLK
ncbi:MAG: cytochrome c oxidase subunit II [Anaerolineales bacterium]|nr:cytochrome c oxidase subunit II [Anaerolineales bacterium]